ncbi:MAG: hypothetical protein GWP08_17345 [Nitrospiraceae bacterium]|nr:hypothetical protein [Nitrospiraceae bacterium]
MSLFDRFLDAPREYTPIPFWFLNDDLTEDELKRQIDDFAAHGVYGFIPHARMGLPESIGFMSDNWLRYTRVCVEHAARKGMYVVLYDEGMYPSGSCAGQVVAANPRHAARCLQRRRKPNLRDDDELVAEDEHYAYVNTRSGGTIRGVHYGTDDGEPGAHPAGDLLNPEAMASFRRLALDPHYETLKEHFGKTVLAVFTDEPSMLGRGAKRGVKPWTWGLEDFLDTTLGYDFLPHLAALWDDGYPDAERYRADFERALDERLEQTYYAPCQQWCREHGIALTGHPDGPCDIGALEYFDWPGQDIVWRYIEPYQDKALEGEQSTMAKCSSSAQHHYGRARNLNECFGAYGWEFTEDEMHYLTNWLFVRGVNAISPHAFYYSLRDKRRDERPPDVGPNSPWWDRYKPYADYCRRMSWLLAEGQHVCPFAILGRRSRLPWRAARVMFETQHDFNYLDIDTLLSHTTVTKDGIAIRDMHYKALIIDGRDYDDANCMEALAPMVESERVIAYAEPIAWVSCFAPTPAELVRLLDVIEFPDVTITPAHPGLRFIHMRHGGADVYFFTNEGRNPIDVEVYVSAEGPRQWWDPFGARVLEDVPHNRLRLPPLGTRILVAGETK